MHSLISRKFLVSIALLGFVMAGTAQAEDLCPEDMLPEHPEGSTPDTVLDDEFGPGTSTKTTCLSKREDVKIVMQLNKSCRDSYATHPTDTNGKPTGEVSRVVNNVANCSRPYALGNLVNMLADLKTTNGVDPEEIDIKVVVHSGGGYLLLNDSGYDGNGNLIDSGRNKFHGLVETLMTQGVKFFFCQNTTRGFIRNKTLPGSELIDSTGGATAQLIPGVEYVTAGVTAISDLQEEGYRYVQP